MFIVDKVVSACEEYKVEKIVLEQLALNGVGSAAKDLAGLYYCILMGLVNKGYPPDAITSISPTTIKSYARTLLPEDEQTFIPEPEVEKPKRGRKPKVEVKANKKPKQIKPKKVKMDKKQMVKVVELIAPDILKDYPTLTSGRADIADATLIAYCYFNEHIIGGRVFK